LSKSSPLVNNIKVVIEMQPGQASDIRSVLQTIPYICIINAENIRIVEESYWLSDKKNLMKITCSCYVDKNLSRSLEIYNDTPTSEWNDLIKIFLENTVSEYLETRRYISFSITVSDKVKKERELYTDLNQALSEFKDSPLGDGDLTYGFYTSYVALYPIRGIYARNVTPERLDKMKKAVKNATEKDIKALCKITEDKIIRVMDKTYMINDVFFDEHEIEIKSHNMSNINNLLIRLDNHDYINLKNEGSTMLNFNIPLVRFSHYMNNQSVEGKFILIEKLLE